MYVNISTDTRAFFNMLAGMLIGMKHNAYVYSQLGQA